MVTRKRPGKRVGRSLYLHRTVLADLPADRRKTVADAARVAEWDDWTVVRLEDSGRVALLEYEPFDEVPFPALLESRLVDGDGRVSRRDFRASANPPILHRKELLLPVDHPRRAEFAALTSALDKRGLFAAPAQIGTRRVWEERLKAAGIVLDGHSLHDPPPAVARHKTAIARDRLSVPMQTLVRSGLVRDGRSVFDYGCGRGDDAAALAAAGIEAAGWDPHWCPGALRTPADVVNLGFVLNVIEDPAEREETARQAFALARVCLCVGVMLVGKASTLGLRRLGDGYISNRGTFQKYFTQAELKDLLERALGQEAIAAAPGVFFVFRNKIEEQRFLSRRLRKDFSLTAQAVPPPRPHPIGRSVRPGIADRNRDALAALWAVALDLGRLPAEDEVPPALVEAIAVEIGSVRRAFGTAYRLFAGDGRLDDAREMRTRDLAVYFALNLFNRWQAYGELPPELQHDVKTFFGSLKAAEAAGRDLLFSLGRPDVIAASCREAAAEGYGYLDGNHALLVDARLAPRLPTALRAYIGCAEKLYGSMEAADVLKIHLSSGKLTLLLYEDYVSAMLPRLKERIKIRMKDQDWDEFSYEDKERILVMKSLVMAEDLPGFAEQEAFDARAAAKLPNLTGPVDLPRIDVEKVLGCCK